MVQVLCRKKGMVDYEYCARTCPDWINAKIDNIFGNTPNTCQDFGLIIRSEEEQAAMGVKYVNPGTAKHDELSKQMAKDEERDVDKISKKTFPIAVSRVYAEAKKIDVPFKSRKVL